MAYRPPAGQAGGQLEPRWQKLASANCGEQRAAGQASFAQVELLRVPSLSASDADMPDAQAANEVRGRCISCSGLPRHAFAQGRRDRCRDPAQLILPTGGR